MSKYNDPEGYDSPPPPVRYRIREHTAQWTGAWTAASRSALRNTVDPPYTLGEIVERQAETAQNGSRWYYSLSQKDQLFADLIVRLVQRACAYFYAKDGEYEPLVGVPDIVVSDQEIAERVRRLDLGENTREANRTFKRRYPLTELPFDQQRALIEQIDALKREWGFEIIGTVEETGENS